MVNDLYDRAEARFNNIPVSKIPFEEGGVDAEDFCKAVIG